MYPKKSLSQNFLRDETVIQSIAKEANPSDTILEIGAGEGALTEKLAERAQKVIAIEFDRDLLPKLLKRFPLSSNVSIIEGDILHTDIPSLLHQKESFLSLPQSHSSEISDASSSPSSKSWCVFGNIPYAITGKIIRLLSSLDPAPNKIVLMVQKEVAERIVAVDRASGKPDKESILSIAVKAYGTPRYVATVKAGSFVPAPKVDSAIIAIESISRNHFPTLHHEQVFFQLVKTGFAHKRKTLAGNLKNNWEPEIVDGAIAAVGLPVAVRAEEIRIETWVALMHAVYEATYR